MNWAYQVMTNGIGGVMCGRTTEDTPIYHSIDTVSLNQKLYSLLMKDRVTSMDQGYIRKVKTVFETKTGRKRYNYELTNEAIINKNIIIKALEKRYEITESAV